MSIPFKPPLPQAMFASVAPTAPAGWKSIPEAFWKWATKRRWFGWLLGLVLLAAVLLTTIICAAHNVHGKALTFWSYTLSASTLLTAAYLLGISLRESGSKLSSLVVGTDRRASTSKLQYLIWTIGVAFALSYISSRIIIGPGTFVCDETGSQTNCVPTGDTWQQYLILLGVPAAAAIVAKGTTVYKVNNGLLQKTNADQAKGLDIATNDNGQADLADVQYLVFNVIAFVYFFAHFVKDGTFAPVPALLLALTSTAAATYTANKVVQSSKPQITAVLPSQLHPGDVVTVTGRYLFPSSAVATAKIGGIAVLLTRTSVDGATIDTGTFTVPASLPDGNQTLTVVTDGAGVETEGYPIQSKAPTILGWVGEPATHGNDATLQLSVLPDDASVQYRVTVGQVAVSATVDLTKNTVAFAIPRTVSAKDYDVTVFADDFEYAKATLHVK